MLLTFVLFSGCYVQNINTSGNDFNRKEISRHLDNVSVALVEKNIYDMYRPFCTGVWISQDEIITAKHCIVQENDDGEDVASIGRVVNFQTYNEFSRAEFTSKAYASYIEGASDKYDLALLHTIDDVNHDTARLYYGTAWAGQHVEILGMPSGLMFSHTESMIAQIRIVNFPHIGEKVIQVNGSSIWFGNSGGGCFDYDTGKLMGIASFLKLDDSHPYAGFYVETSSIREFLTEWNVAFNY